MGGGEDIDISHPRYADDTLLVGVASMGNTRVLKNILRCFELISELK